MAEVVGAGVVIVAEDVFGTMLHQGGLFQSGISGAIDTIVGIGGIVVEAIEFGVAKLRTIAEETVVAGAVVGTVGALARPVATIRGAIDAIITVDGGPGLAEAVLAQAGPGTGVVVIATGAIGRLVIAAIHGAAQVRGAGIVIVATASDTDAGSLVIADIVGGAGIGIIAGPIGIGGVCAATTLFDGQGDALIHRAGVVVVALHRGARYAGAFMALVTVGTAVAIIAGEIGLVDVGAGTGLWLTGIGGAIVVVVAQRCGAGADGITTLVLGGAEQTVVAGGPVGGRQVGTACFSVTTVYGAIHQVIALFRLAPQTFPGVGALVIGGARVPIVARLVGQNPVAAGVIVVA